MSIRHYISLLCRLCQSPASIIIKTQATKKIRFFTSIFISFTFHKRYPNSLSKNIKQSKIIAVPLASSSNFVELYIIISFDDDHGKSKDNNYLRLRVVVI